jgi:hypothetical protein
MSRTSKKTATADEIADMASRGEDISAYFTNKFTVVRPAIKTLLARARKRKGGSGGPPQA